MIKLVATDLDGTLIKDNGEIDNRIFTIINYLSEKGIIFAAASGRYYSTLCSNFSSVKDMIIIAHNGAVVQHINEEKLLFKNCIRKDLINEIIKLAREKNLTLSLATKDWAYVEKPTKELINSFNRGNVKYVITEDLTKVKNDIYKVTFYEPLGIKDSTIKLIEHNFSDKVEFVLSGKKWLDLSNIGINKGMGIEILQNKFNIKKEETMVFGDYFNDIPMFNKAYFSYAVENAPLDVKRFAKFIAKSNNHNGVIETLNNHFLIL